MIVNVLAMKRILYIVTRSEHGGAQQYVASLMSEMKARGHASVLVTGSRGWLTHESMDIADKIIVIPELLKYYSPLAALRLVGKLINILLRTRFDVIHLNSSVPLAIAPLARLCTQAKIIFTYHGLSVAYPGWRKNIIIQILHRPHFFIFSYFVHDAIFVSHADERMACALRLCNTSSRTVIHNGVSEMFFFDKNDARCKLESYIQKPLRGVKVIGTVGRLEYQKNMELFIHTANRFKNRESVWLVLGAGSQKQSLDNVIRSEMLGSFVFIIDSLVNPSHYLKAYDMFVCTSRYEGLPYAILEAMAAGLPIVAPRVGGISEIISHNKNGLLFNANDIDELQQRVVELFDDNSKSENFGRKAMADCMQKFDASQMIGRTVNIYMG